MGDLSEHFSRKEFACRCGCGQDTVDAKLIQVLERLRTHYDGQPIRINSGNRCVEYNRRIGGKQHSQHLLSKAADIVVGDIEPGDVYMTLDRLYPGKFGVGSYHNFTHVDVRDKKARWRA